MAGWTPRRKRGPIVSKSYGMQTDSAFQALGKPSKVVVSEPREAGEGQVALNLLYPLLGHREYSHGSSMFEGMLASIECLEPDLANKEALIRRFKIMDSFDTLSTAVAMDSAKARKHPELKKAAARLDVIVGGRERTSLLFPRTEPTSERLAEYDPANFIGAMDYENGGGSFVGIADMVDLFRGINECNRLLTVDGFPHPDWSRRVRLAYFEDLPILSSGAAAAITGVSFSPQDMVDIGSHRFEIKKGILDGPSVKKEFVICFFIELPDGGENEL